MTYQYKPRKPFYTGDCVEEFDVPKNIAECRRWLRDYEPISEIDRSLRSLNRIFLYLSSQFESWEDPKRVDWELQDQRIDDIRNFAPHYPQMCIDVANWLSLDLMIAFQGDDDNRTEYSRHSKQTRSGFKKQDTRDLAQKAYQLIEYIKRAVYAHHIRAGNIPEEDIPYLNRRGEGLTKKQREASDLANKA